MSIFLKAAALVCIISSLTVTAEAGKKLKDVANIHQISGTHSRDEIQAKCEAVGGVSNNTQGTSGSYGCDNLNKGTSVVCTAGGKCTGYTPK